MLRFVPSAFESIIFFLAINDFFLQHFDFEMNLEGRLLLITEKYFIKVL